MCVCVYGCEIYCGCVISRHVEIYECLAWVNNSMCQYMFSLVLNNVGILRMHFCGSEKQDVCLKRLLGI